MKKNIIVLGSIALFMALFYKQDIGINLFIFNLILIALVYYAIPKARKSLSIGLLSAGAFISSASVAWYADPSSIIVNIITLIILPVFLHHQKSTILFSESLGLWNIFSVPARIFTENRGNGNDKKQNMLGKRILIFGLLPFIVFVLFFYLYRHINPVWGEYMWELIGSIFSWSFVFLLLFAIILMYSFWNFTKMMNFNNWTTEKANKLAPTEKPTFESIPLKMEMWSGVLLFSLLNLLLFSLLATDFQQLCITGKIPEGYTLSEYLHKGIYAVILSIIFAIGLIVFYFKGALNFYKHSKLLKVLTWIWLFFNAILILFTIYKNVLYVEVYDLTFLRVSTFIYLGLCWVGLYFTAKKLLQYKSFVYLVRKMYWAFYIMWILTTPMNWTNWITEYNLSHALEKEKKESPVDLYYITERLNEQNITALYHFLEKSPENSSNINTMIKKGLDKKYDKVVQSNAERTLREKRLYDIWVINKLKKWKYKPYYAKVTDEKFYTHLASVKDLEFTVNYHKDSADIFADNLLKYSEVQRLFLTIYSSPSYSIKKLSEMANLKSLNLEGNFSEIGTLDHLETLHINAKYANSKITFTEPLPKLTELVVRGRNIKTFKGFKNLPALKHLELDANGMLPEWIPDSLTFLKINGQGMHGFNLETPADLLTTLVILNGQIKSLKAINNMPQLTSLTVNSSRLETLNGITQFPKLKELHISNNHKFSDLSPLVGLKNLRLLHIAYNEIANISVLKKMPQLQKVYIQGNPIDDYSPLYSLPNLKKLAIYDSSKIDKSRLPKGCVVEDMRMRVENRTEAEADVEEVVEVVEDYAQPVEVE